jgi:Lecithin retinol acyltransferase
MSDIQPGLWIKVDCKNSFGLGFEHDGIVVAVQPNAMTPKDVQVIHFAWNQKADTRLITETTMDVFLDMGNNARVVGTEYAFPHSTIVERARSQIGRPNYNLLGQNCQHFARWCCQGSAFSKELFKYSVIGATFGLVVALAGILGITAATAARGPMG